MAAPAVRVIGPGRAGLSLARGLDKADWRVRQVLGRGDDVTAAAAGVDLLVLAVPDGTIAEVAAAVEPAGSCVVAHLAGALGLEVLAPHERRASVHPLRSLPTTSSDLTGAWFAVAGDPISRQVVEALEGRVVEVGDADRTAYHAAAVMASNHLVALLGAVQRVAASAGVPLGAFLDLVRGTVDNVEVFGPAAALTGPVARGDWDTVARHLVTVPESERATYQALTAAAKQLAPQTRPATPASGAPTSHPTEAMKLLRRGPRLSSRHVSGAASMRSEPKTQVEVHETIESFRKALDAERLAGRTVGLVPTMGYLHEGHASLLRRAAAECDVAAATIFVNPLQFAADEDLSTYPRDLDGDIRLAGACGVAHLFTPSDAEMYPEGREGVLTTVHVDGPSEGLEGASRPTHFDGVATVVAKLFAIAGECRAYFGEKDWQQLLVIRQLVRDLSFPVEVVACPIVREDDGLARSSRNVRLTPEQRTAATVLHRALVAGRDAAAAGADPAQTEAAMGDVVATEPLADLDYAAVRDGRLLIAARFGPVRLIDNLELR